MATSMILNQCIQKKTLSLDANALNIANNDEGSDKTLSEDSLRERFLQQLYGNTTVWLRKQGEVFLRNSMKNVTNILNKGNIVCPNCKAKDSWSWMNKAH